MIDGYADPDAAANLLERRWFSSIRAVRDARSECEVLREVMELAETDWRRACTQLAELESLRDAFGEQLATRDGHWRSAADSSPTPSKCERPAVGINWPAATSARS
jgi:hypothetical protein